MGYNTKDKKLVVNQPEAETVRLIYRHFLELKCLRRLKVELDEKRGRFEAKIQFIRSQSRRDPVYLWPPGLLLKTGRILVKWATRETGIPVSMKRSLISRSSLRFKSFKRQFFTRSQQRTGQPITAQGPAVRDCQPYEPKLHDQTRGSLSLLCQLRHTIRPSDQAGSAPRVDGS